MDVELANSAICLVAEMEASHFLASVPGGRWLVMKRKLPNGKVHSIPLCVLGVQQLLFYIGLCWNCGTRRPMHRIYIEEKGGHRGLQCGLGGRFRI